MRLLPFAALLSFLAACRFDLHLPPEPLFGHPDDPGIARQQQLLQADEVSLSPARSLHNGTAHTYLELLVLNPKNQPASPDSLPRRVRKLALLLVADLQNAADYEALYVRIQTNHNYLIAQTSRAQTFIYPLDSLR